MENGLIEWMDEIKYFSILFYTEFKKGILTDGI
jgi:hypothetical protein